MGSASDGTQDTAGTWPTVPPPGDGSAPLSSAQQALWLADQAVRGGAQYHLGWIIQLDGLLDIAALRAALVELAGRHELLRASVPDQGGQPVLAIAPAAASTLGVADVAETEADALARAVVVRPFAPAGPLWRAELHRVTPVRHRLILVLHHLIADEATIAVLFAELAAAYRAWHEGHPPELPPAVPYRQFLTREREYLSGPGRAADVAYWIGQMHGAEPLELPADRPRRPGSRRPGTVQPVHLSAPVADALRRLAASQGGTLTQLLLTCYAVVLHRYAGQDEFIVGVPVSVRRGEERGAAVGLYVNTVPIRMTMAGNPPFDRLLAQVRSTIVAALGAARAPMADVAAAVHAQRSMAAGRLFDVTFGLSRKPRAVLNLPGLDTRVTGVHSGQAKFDLHLEITDGGPGAPLDGMLDFDTDLFDSATAQRLADSFATIAATIAEAPGQHVGDLPLWPGASSGSTIDEPGQELPGGGRVDVLLARIAAELPDQVALVDADGGGELRYAELASRAGAVAAALAEHGIGRGDFVGITLPRSADMVLAILGVLAVGAAYVPLDTGYPAAQLAEMVRTAGVRLLIGPALAGLSEPAMDLPPAAVAAPPVAAPPVAAPPVAAAGSGEDAAYVMFTSGSTGAPKAVVVPHRAIVRLVRGTGFAAMTSTERWLHCASPAFDAATLELWAPLLNGGTLVVLPGTPTVASLAETIRRHGVTSAFLTTGMFNLVMDTDPAAVSPLRDLVTGGEAASAEHVRLALKSVAAVVNGYGPTENTTFSSCHVMRGPAAVVSPVPVGTPINGTCVHIVDAYLSPMPPGAVGEILLGGQGLAIGYASAPGLTAERFVPSPFGPPGARVYRTGDYGWLDADGVLHFAGRRDDQVKVRGFRIELDSIEQVLLRHPRVRQAAVTVHADPTGDRRLVGYIVGTADPGELTEYLRELLPGYMIPGQWIELDALPLGPTGKVDRRVLPGAAVAAVPRLSPDTVAEKLLIAWYIELLGVADVTPETNFYAVGGHSLFAVRLVSRIRQVFDVDIPVDQVFANPRVADLAAAVTAATQAANRSPELVL